jgi:peptidoglycan/LPS O-acetylase OafA/YrhL
MVIALGAAGLLRHRRLQLALTACLIALWIAGADVTFPKLLTPVIGNFDDSLRFFSIFCTGGAFYLFRDRIAYRGRDALLAAILLIPLMFVPSLAGPALAVLGGYILFWFAFRRFGALSRIGTRVDLSYGVYLYAWPIQSLLIWYMPGITPWETSLLATPMALLCAYASWTFVESPCLKLKAHTPIAATRLRT